MKPTIEQVLAWARRANVAKHGLGWTCWESQLERFAALAYAAGAAAMKERAAKVCESLFDAEDDSCDEAEKCAEAIRELGDDDD